jgi:hypothetical protein
VRVILHICSQIQPKCSSLRYVIPDPSKIQYICSSSYAGFNIQLNVSLLLLVICRQFNTGYTLYLLPNTVHISRFVLHPLWSRSNPTYLQFCRFCYNYKNQRIAVSIEDMTKIRYVLFSTLLPNTGHTSQFALCQMFAVSNPA